MSIVSVLGESAVRSLALALAVAVVLRLLRVQHARIAKRAWTAVLILALAMPALVALHIPSFSFTPLWATPQTIIVSPPPASAFQANVVTAPASAAIQQTPASPADLAPAVTLSVPVPRELQGPPAPVQHAVRHIALWQIGFAAYLAITALLLLRVLLGLSLAGRLWRRAQPFASSETDLPVRLSVDLRSPATVGHGILLPLEAVGWDDATLRTTLAHEAQHIREGDFYLQLAATLHHCFFWISPHAWWLRPQLSRLSETICDRAAIASGGDGLSYAQLLLRFAVAEQAPAGMVAMAQSAGLRERIDRLIADPELTGAFRKRRGQAIAAAALFAAAALVAAASIHIVQPQMVVLAAPQAPAGPPATPQSPSAPADAPPLPPPPAPDAVLAPGPGIGIGVGEGAGVGQSEDGVVRVQPGVHVQVHAVPPDGQTQVFDGSDPDGMPSVLALGPMTAVVPIGPYGHGRTPNHDGTHMKIREHAARPGFPVRRQSNSSSSTDATTPYVAQTTTVRSTTASSTATASRITRTARSSFERDGKTYIIDDPALVKQAQDAYARVGELGKQQGELGAQQGKLGAQQGELGALQGELGAMQGQLGAMQGHFDMPDFHFEMPEGFNQAVQSFTDSTTRLALDQKLSDADRARLEAEQKEARANFDKALADWKAQQPQREAMEKQIRQQAEQIRKQMEPLIEKMHELGTKQGDLGRMQGELGRQQALLGIQQREASREADRKMQSLIDQAMKEGKAHPAQ